MLIEEGFLMLTQLPPKINGQQMKLFVLQLLKETVQNPVPSSIAVFCVKVDFSLF